MTASETRYTSRGLKRDVSMLSHNAIGVGENSGKPSLTPLALQVNVSGLPARSTIAIDLQWSRCPWKSCNCSSDDDGQT